MATAKKGATTMEVKPEDRVPVKLPRLDGNGDEQVYVSVNDYSCIIPRGQTVMVPKFVADEIERSEAAKDRLFATRESHLSKQ